VQGFSLAFDWKFTICYNYGIQTKKEYMNLKLKAALQTAGVLAVICTVSVVVQLLLTGLTADEISKILSVGSITLLVYCMYQLVLSRLEYTQKLEEINQK
jgi:putative flippase GtrA